MFERNVGIEKIVRKLGLDDADELYEITYAYKIKNRVSIATKKYGKTQKESKTNYGRVQEFISIYANNVLEKPLNVLEMGSGNGQFAYKLASAFPQVNIVGIELTTSGVEYAKKYFKADNLSFSKEDGYKIPSYEDGCYDIVYHINVLEHVPDQTAYLEKGLNLLKRGGGMLVAFPTLKYWIFWGWPKYLLCKLLGKEFKYHGWDTRYMDQFIKYNQLCILEKKVSVFCLPRRLYYYIPNSLLSPIGSLFRKVEDVLQHIGITFPLMFAYYALTKSDVQRFKKNILIPSKTHKTKHSTIRNYIHFGTWVLPTIAFLLLISNLMMGWEVISGRKEIFDQH